MKGALIFLFLLLVSFCHGAAADTHSWPMARGSAQGEAAIYWQAGAGESLEEWHYTWKSRVRYKAGTAVWASPALTILDGHPVAFIGGYDQTLHALDLVAKRALWRRMTNAEIAAAPVVGALAGRAVVFFASNDRTLYALDARSGATRWTRELVPASPTLGEADFTSPLLFAGRLYVAGFTFDRSLAHNSQRAVLYAFNPDDGTPYWRLEIGAGFVSEPIGYIVGGTNYVAVAARKGLLQSFDVSGSRPRLAWSYQMPHEVYGACAVERDSGNPVLVLGSKYGNLIALEAASGRERWKRMAGNWFDNSACIGAVDGTNIVFAGSHDYSVYAMRAADGALLWKRPLGGEVYAAPAFFELEGKPALLVAALDNHVHTLDARNGRVIASYYTGKPLWDKINKGENRWGSPAVVEAGADTVAVHGSFNATVYTLPLARDCSMQARARSSRGLWLSLAVVAVIFGGVVLPILRRTAD